MHVENFKIRKTYIVFDVYEISVDCGGWNYLVIFGKHINGWFAAIPNHNVCAEISDPADVYYNTVKISTAIKDAAIGVTLAVAIKKYWEEEHENQN